jgi:hypothetical protein
MSARKLSKVSTEEMSDLNGQLRNLFERFSDCTDAITAAVSKLVKMKLGGCYYPTRPPHTHAHRARTLQGCAKFATDCGLVDKKLTGAEVDLICKLSMHFRYLAHSLFADSSKRKARKEARVKL